MIPKIIQIPKVIHYCWFGNNPKNEEITRCIESWKKTNPDFEIKEWNEINFPFETFPFASKMYNEKKWAFVADYARLHILQSEGGFYLDTDMLLLKSLAPFLDKRCVLGKESDTVISAGMIAATAEHSFIRECRDRYDSGMAELITIPRILTDIYEQYDHKELVIVLPPKAFYPFDSEHIGEYKGQDMGPEVYGVHLWHYSWGSPINKFFKKIGIYSFGKGVVETLGIKQILKKLLGFV